MPENNQAEIILEKYAQRLGSKGRTRQLYLNYARDFLEYSGGRFDRESIEKYMDHLRRSHHRSDGTVNFIFRLIRTMANRNNIEWPFNRGDSPQIREDRIKAPALDPNLIIEMIEAVKEGGDATERAFLSISTTYGTRKEEMIELTDQEVNIKDQVLHIATKKHGRERTHLIPDEILPYLQEYDFSKPITESAVFMLWYRIEHRIGLQHIDQVGWHAIRRTLDTLLLESLPLTTVRMFLRWKKGTSSDMAFRYSAQRFVGREGTKTKVVGEALETDTKVFKVHPFLKYWK